MNSFRGWISVVGQHKVATVAIGLLMLLNVPLTLFSVLAVAFAFKQINGVPQDLAWQDLLGNSLGAWLKKISEGTDFESGLTVGQQLEFFIPSLVAAAVLLFGVRFWQEWLLESTGERICKELRDKISQRYAKMTFVEAEAEPVGTLSQMFADDCREIRQTYTRLWGSIPNEILVSLAHCALLVLMDFQLFLLLLAVLAPAGIVIRVSGKKLKTLARQGLHLQSSLLETLLEKSRGWETIQTLDRVDRELHSFERSNRSLFQVWRRSARARSAAQPLVEWLGICAGAAVLVLALRRVADGALSSSLLTAYLVTIASLANSLQGAVGQLNSTRKGTECLKRVQSFLRCLLTPAVNGFGQVPENATRVSLESDETSVQKSSAKSNEKSGMNSDRMFESLEVSDYPTLKGNNLSFAVKKGEMAAIVGPSGAGKSTLIKTLLGLLPLGQNAKIRWNGRALERTEDLAPLTHQVALLPQEPYLVPGTVLENIVYPRNHGSPDDLAKALKSLGRARLSSRGLDESIAGLSGGERQRLMFARAFYRDASLWIMDEATSALDAETEQKIVEEMLSTKKERIVIMVAHRSSMKGICDRVVEI